jgi:hypothetical protein
MLHFTEKIEPQKIVRLLSRSLPYYLKSWVDIDEHIGIFGSTDPTYFNMRSVGSSSPVIEYVIRPHLNILCILGGYIYSDQTEMISAIISREELELKIKKGLRWACETHLNGSLDVNSFLKRKRWGENWRSSLWATLLGICRVLCNDILDDDLKNKIKTIIAFEADRFIDVCPPSGCEIDTKVEENAQDSMLLAWAINSYPEHPHIEDWERTFRVWSVNIASCIHDTIDHSEYFGSSLSRAVTTKNLFPDFTAENHGFFNPEVLTYGIWVVLAMAGYSFHNQERPAYLQRRNHQRAFDNLLRFCLPNGMLFAPGGQDMPLFIPRPLALAWGLWNNDPRALHLTSKLLSWMDSYLLTDRESQGPWVFGFDQHHEGWELFFQSQVGLELSLLACLPFPQEERFFSAGQIEKAIDTRHIYPHVQVCYRRNIRTTRSVAWKALGNHPLVGLNIHTQPELLASFKGALLGIPTVNEPVKQWEVMFHQDRFQRDGFDTSGRISYNGSNGQPLLKRDVRILTWGDDGLVIFDEIIAEKQLEVHEQYLSPVYLVNDHWTGNNLDFNSGSLREQFSAYQHKFREVSCPSFWASIENHFLFQFLWGRTKGLYYLPGGEKNAPPYWKNCRLDMLAIHVEQCTAAKGDIVYRVGFFVGAGKGPRPFKITGTAGEFFKGLVIMDGKGTVGLN